MSTQAGIAHVLVTALSVTEILRCLAENTGAGQDTQQHVQLRTDQEEECWRSHDSTDQCSEDKLSMGMSDII